MTGRLISSKRTMANPNTHLNITELKQGVYFITVLSKNYNGQEFNRTLKLMVL